METLHTISKMTNWRNREIAFCALLFLFFFCAPLLAQTLELPSEVNNIKELFERGDIAQGALALTTFETENPKSEHLPMLWLSAGRAQKSVLDAAPFFRRILDSWSQSRQAPVAQMELAEVFYISGNGRAAAAEARRLIENYPDHPRVLEALIMLGTVEMQAGRTGKAASRFADAAVRFEGNSKSAVALVGMADCKYRLKDYDGAQKAYFAALQKKHSTLDQAKVYYQLGMIGQKLKRPGETRRYFLLLCKNYPHSRYAAQAQTALETIGEASATAPLLGEQILGTLNIPRVEFTVQVGTAGSQEGAEKKSKRFVDAGYEVTVRKCSGVFIIQTGRFTGEMDAFIFAQKLERKFGIKTDVISLENGETR